MRNYCKLRIACKAKNSKWGGLMIETHRCILRCFEEKDLYSFMTYRNNEEWMKYQDFKNLRIDEYRRVLLVPFNLEKGAQLAIADKSTDKLLGDLYLAKKERTITIGYTIDPIYSRKGYISEVLNALLPKLKADYSGCEIVAMTEKENTPSKNLLLKLVFVYDGWIEKWESEVYTYSK
jgi:RimJ/RimL family protein N-acetyltransferase